MDSFVIVAGFESDGFCQVLFEQLQSLGSQSCRADEWSALPVLADALCMFPLRVIV